MISTPNTQQELTMNNQFILLFIFISDLVIIFDIPILRQILGFIFLTILPGLVILNILKINVVSFLEKFVLIWGISISFLMVLGLSINAFGDLIGYTTPLSFSFFFILFNIIIISLVIISFLVNKESIRNFNYSFLNLRKLEKNIWLSPNEKVFLIFPILLPAFSVFGTHIMNTYNCNTFLIIYLVLITTYIFFISFFCRKFPRRIYPITIYLISLSLVLVTALRSGDIIGYDAHDEFGIFLKTLIASHWNIENISILEACLSISILPTIYNIFLKSDEVYLFKILYPLLFSIIPLVIFIIANRYLDSSYAFLASFLYMSQRYFLYTTSYPRSNLAILFFSLAIMVLLTLEIDNKNKRLFFLAFLVSCILSHYSTSFIFFFLILAYWLASKLLSKLISKNYCLQNYLSLAMLILFFVVMYFWYSQITSMIFKEGLIFTKKTFISLGDIFIKESMSPKTTILFGEGFGERAIPFRIEFILTWLTFILTGLGLISLASDCLKQTLASLKDYSKLNSVELKSQLNYLLMTIVSAGLLVVSILLPYVAKGYSIERQYLQAMAVLSTCFIMGGIFISNTCLKIASRIEKNDKYLQLDNSKHIFANLVILMVLIPYFLCITGIMYIPFDVPREMTLNSEGYQYNSLFVHSQDITCGKWLEKYVDPEAGWIYTDLYAWQKFRRFHIIKKMLNDDALINHDKLAGYIYLSYYNTMSKKLLGVSMSSLDLSGYSETFTNRHKIYNNGGSDVWN